MFVCPSCKIDVAVFALDDIRSHLNEHKMFGHLNYPISCCQQNCKSTFESIRNFQRHFHSFHLADLDRVAEPYPDLIELHENIIVSPELVIA